MWWAYNLGCYNKCVGLAGNSRSAPILRAGRQDISRGRAGVLAKGVADELGVIILPPSAV